MNAYRSSLFPSGRLHLLLMCLIGLWLSLGVAHKAHADSCTGGGQTISLSFPATLTVGRDTPVGSVISQWISSPWIAIPCTSTKPNPGVGIDAGMLLSGTTGYTVSHGGYSYPVYATNYPGIGIAVGWYDNVSPYGQYDDGPVPLSLSGYVSSGFTVAGGMIYMAFVKTGTISGGTLAGQSVAQLVPITATTSGTATNITKFYGNADTFSFPTMNVVAASCTTPDVSVPLGTWSTTSFTGAGSTTTAVGFNVSLNNCPAGMNSISYRVDPTTSVLNSPNSVVALDSSSTATGVGVQLLNNSSNPLPLSSYQTFSGYSSSTGGSYTIPLKARYYQTGATVGPGPANTSMTLTMQYL
ncbi:fimbrial protein [Paraburkholderia azotifigens]|uniref:fimbrial protein n=1 Tax=Paraburkholderia azotifigens TaxID=2057004 RepID=UPI0031766AB9